MKSTQHHFSEIAHIYRKLRTTDLEPILFIKKKLENLTEIKAADIGSGGGRYDIELFYHLGKRLALTCIDINESMLNTLCKNLNELKIENFKTIRSPANKLPLPDDSLDCIFTFNAVHHFNLAGFLKEVSRVLKTSGSLFIYTRLKSQNQTNIWGRYFPKFYEKETRLYELNDFKESINGIPNLKIESIQYYKFNRKESLERLTTQAKNRHYSTFSLYNDVEFEESFEGFRKNISFHFKDPGQITWDSEHTMIVVLKHI